MTQNQEQPAWLRGILAAGAAFVMCASAMTAQTNVGGIVTDSQGDPLIGATVFQKGTDHGTATDAQGRYFLTLTPGAKTIVVSYIGYLTKDINVTSATEDVVLSENTSALDEVVVVGYGSMQRKDISSSISTISAKDMNRGAYTDPAQMLQGKVPGLSVVQSSDPNGGTASITLRGASTFRKQSDGAAEPYYVIDGIPGASLHTVAPDDIESIDVLRDASATAIYGSKASNGVILITTKSGKEGRTSVSYSGYYSFENAVNEPEMMTASQLRAYAKDNNIPLPNDLGYDTDWTKEVTRTGWATNHNLSISGGNAKTNYNASVNYMRRMGVIRGTDMDRLIGRAIVKTHTLKDRLEISLGVNGSVSNNNSLYTEHGWGKSPYYAMYYYSPLVPVRNEDGTWYKDLTISQNYNPLATVNEDHYKKTFKRIQLIGKLSLKIIDGLFANGNFSYQNQNYGLKEFHSQQSQITDAGRNGDVKRETTEDIRKTMELYANYDKTFGRLKFGAMVGYSWEEESNADGFGAEKYNFYDDSLGWNNIGMGNSIDADGVWDKAHEMRRMISYYGRLTFSWDSKYMLQGTLRRDGASVFGSNNHWGTFGAVSAAWRLTQESFLQDQDVLNDLKLRVGYGVSGNALGFNAFTSKLYYDANGWFDYNGHNYHTLGTVRNQNDDLRWERTKMLNVGLDWAFLNGRLNGTVEFYHKKTNDLIYDYPVDPARYPVNWMTANVGDITNNGVEISINAVPVQGKDWNWSTSLMLSHNHNVVNHISNQNFSMPYIDTYNPDLGGNSTAQIQRIMEGQPIGTFYMWEWAGYNENNQSVFYVHDPETNERTGETTTSPGNTDRTICGNAQPKLTLGWNNDLSWRNWNLNAFFTGAFGQKIFNEIEADFSEYGKISSGKNVLANFATEQRAGDAMSNAPSDRYLENGSYFKLASLTLGYTFNRLNGWANSIRIYATCNNVFTITSYKGRDPEINLGGLEPGIDMRYQQYPRTRQFLFGLNINF